MCVLKSRIPGRDLVGATVTRGCVTHGVERTGGEREVCARREGHGASDRAPGRSARSTSQSERADCVYDGLAAMEGLCRCAVGDIARSEVRWLN